MGGISTIPSTFPTKLPQQELFPITETRICQEKPFPGPAEDGASGLNKRTGYLQATKISSTSISLTTLPSKILRFL